MLAKGQQKHLHPAVRQILILTSKSKDECVVDPLKLELQTSKLSPVCVSRLCARSLMQRFLLTTIPRDSQALSAQENISLV